MLELDFYRSKSVLVTGHTGFKGAWLCHILKKAGARVTGYSLVAPTDPSLFELISISDGMNSVIGDVRDIDAMRCCFDRCRPEIVIHLAAQPIVKEGYEDPLYTYETNVMGTVNLLECVRHSDSVRSVINVTTDKVYKNREWEWGYRENEELCGLDPYSNSKSCSELVTYSYNESFFKEKGIAVSTARAGNVIGGGDFARDRIIPDCIRAAMENRDIVVRNPHSTRPYQHVIEPLMAYLMIAEAQYRDPSLAGSYNVGPDYRDCIETGRLAELFCSTWGEGVKWRSECESGPQEANFLKLDCSKLNKTFGWTPTWDIQRAVRCVVEWTTQYRKRKDLLDVMDAQIEEFIRESEWIKS